MPNKHSCPIIHIPGVRNRSTPRFGSFVSSGNPSLPLQLLPTNHLILNRVLPLLRAAPCLSRRRLSFALNPSDHVSAASPMSRTHSAGGCAEDKDRSTSGILPGSSSSGSYSSSAMPLPSMVASVHLLRSRSWPCSGRVTATPRLRTGVVHFAFLLAALRQLVRGGGFVWPLRISAPRHLPSLGL